MGAVRGQLTVRSAALNKDVVAWMGSEPPTVIGGYAKWEIVERPRRVGFTQWVGREPIQMTVPLVLDGFRDNQHVESDITNLHRMAMPIGGKQPPTVKILGSSMPHEDLTWIIMELEWGDTIRNLDGDRLRQEVVLTICSYVPLDKVKLSAAQLKRGEVGRR